MTVSKITDTVRAVVRQAFLISGSYTPLFTTNQNDAYP